MNEKEGAGMTKTYELPNEKRIMADIDEEHHTATVSVYALDDLVETVNKTGHWEQYGNSWEDKFKCSECGKEQPKILCGERIIGHWSDYCPNCGARMIEPQESEG